MAERRRTTNTPSWVKVAVVLIIILHLTGNGFGEHVHVSIIEYGEQPQ